MAQTQLVLTPTGRAKIDRFLTVMRTAAVEAVTQAVTTLKPAVAQNAPSPEEEALILSQGFGGSGIRGAGGTVQQPVGLFGTPEGGRFLREQGMISMREAIALEPVEVRRTQDSVVAGFGRPAQINAKTGFFWDTRRRGVQGPTLPFNEAYVQALENGGVVWTVVPRPGTRALEPEPGRISYRMLKTVGPVRMFQGTLTMRRTQITARVQAGLKQAAQGIK